MHGGRGIASARAAGRRGWSGADHGTSVVVGRDRGRHRHEDAGHDHVAVPAAGPPFHDRDVDTRLRDCDVLHVVDHDDRHDDSQREPHGPPLWACLPARAAPGQAGPRHRADFRFRARISSCMGCLQRHRDRTAMGPRTCWSHSSDVDVERKSSLLGCYPDRSGSLSANSAQDCMSQALSITSAVPFP